MITVKFPKSCFNITPEFGYLVKLFLLNFLIAIVIISENYKHGLKKVFNLFKDSYAHLKSVSNSETTKQAKQY